MLPSQACLYCNGLIDLTRLQRESLSRDDRQTQDYLGVGDVVDPSVITLNGISAAHAATLMMRMVTGLADDSALAHRLHLPLTGEALNVQTTRADDCPFCVQGYARGGGGADLPVRLAPGERTCRTLDDAARRSPLGTRAAGDGA